MPVKKYLHKYHVRNSLANWHNSYPHHFNIFPKLIPYYYFLLKIMPLKKKSKIQSGYLAQFSLGSQKRNQIANENEMGHCNSSGTA